MWFYDIIIILLLVFISIILLKNSFNRTVYMGAMKQYMPEKDVTTVLPIPIHSATCDHDWEVVTEQKLEMSHEKKVIILLACRRCGVIDKTVQVTSTQPPPMPEPPCKHEWQVVTQQNLEMSHEKKIVVVMTCRLCGQVDKTTEVTSKMPAPQWNKADCCHKWDTEKRVVLDSAYEQMLKSISVKSYNSNKAKVDPNKDLGLNLNEAPPWMFKKAYICVRTCRQCGEIDKTIASNFDTAEDEESILTEDISVKLNQVKKA